MKELPNQNKSVAASKASSSRVRLANGLSRKSLLRECVIIAFANMMDYVRIAEDGCIKLREDITKNKARAIRSIDQYASGGVRVTLYDKKHALEMLYKHTGIGILSEKEYEELHIGLSELSGKEKTNRTST